VVLVGEWRNSYIVLVGKPKGKIPFGWGEDTIKVHGPDSCGS
jgi:hypothetical protein